MIKKNKHPKISPHFVKDENGKNIEIYLKYNVYESILNEMDEIKKHIKELKKKTK